MTFPAVMVVVVGLRQSGISMNLRKKWPMTEVEKDIKLLKDQVL
jgi:hypothetical protein